MGSDKKTPIVPPKELRLMVPFFRQNDNQLWQDETGDYVAGNVQCAATSNAAALAFLRPDLVAASEAQKFAEFECFYKDKFNSLGYSASDRGNHDAHTETLAAFGVDSVWRTDLSHDQICASLVRSRPVVAGFCFKSHGHIVVIVGQTEHGYLVHDCYGERSGASDDYAVINDGSTDDGAFELYSWATLALIFFGDGSTPAKDRSGGWGRVFS